MTEQLILDEQDKMEKTLEALRHEMSKLRTGRASLGILEDVRVDYYGQMVPLNQVATLGIPEPRLITITPWETKQIQAIEKAIEKANIGLTPANDGKMIRLPVPALTEERRKDLVKVIKQHAEESKVSIRHSRRQAMDIVKKQEKEGVVTEDDAKKFSVDIQKVTDDFIKKIDEVVHKKEEEVMHI